MIRLGRSAAALLVGLMLGLTAWLGSGCAKNKESDPAAVGRELFASSCARCHGSEGTGGLPVSAGGPSPRNFHERAFQSERTDQQIKLTIVNGKGTAMPAFGPAFSDAQLDALVAHVRSFGRDRETK
jgi:cytochrome c oxidase cbb3-type subunit 3